jgi:hypothetical protein
MNVMDILLFGKIFNALQVAQRQQQQKLLQQQQQQSVVVNGPSKQSQVNVKGAQITINTSKMNGVCSEVFNLVKIVIK